MTPAGTTRVNQIHIQLGTISKNIDEIHDNGIVELNRAAELKMQLEEIEKNLGIYEMMQEIDLSADIPKYTLSFGSPSVDATDLWPAHDFTLFGWIFSLNYGH